MKVLVAGGAGYIGSTVASALLDAGHDVVVLDNLSTGRREFCTGRTLYQGDIADRELLRRIFSEHPDLDAAVHCAALIVVPESVAQPVRYYRENVAKTLDFIEGLLEHGVQRLVFSSSGSIYQPGPDLTVDETSALYPLSPYARTKVVVELMLGDVAAATPLRMLSLRYFNPVGADPQLRSGMQAPHPSHVLGQLVEAHQQGSTFALTGTDYPTRDGSGLRDYVHVWDLATAHVAALERFDAVVTPQAPAVAVNLGTGTGTTVLELLQAFQQVTGSDIDVTLAPRRPGDSAGACTRSELARDLLGWTAQLSLAEGISDTLRWFAVRSEKLPDLT